MAIRIFSKKAFAIGPGAQQGNPEIESFVTVPNAFQDMPEKYKNDPTFLLAVKCGDITVITAANKTAIENEPEKPVIDDKAGMSEIEAFYEELKIMNKEDAITLGEKYNVKPKNGEKMGAFKKRILEAYKLSVSDETASEDEAVTDNE